MRLQIPGLCTYCGQLASARDHLVPVSRQHPRRIQNFGTVAWVIACNECNNILGAVPRFTVPERAEYLLGRLRARYKKLLTTPDWTEDELDELKPRLRRDVERTLAEKAAVAARIARVAVMAGRDDL